MTLPARFSLLHSDLNDFLFASVGDQQNGMPLNVVSALTRLGVDPWEEAARLAALPRPLAAQALAPRIALLPIGQEQLADNLAVSRRLVELLPSPGRTPSQRTTVNSQKYYKAMMLLACVALGAVVLFTLL
jgi:hypothetical protein